MNRRPNSGEIYRHFKEKMYQIITIARHSETGEELVIYQALYGDYKCYARPLEMFVSEVDHQKYPEVKQKYRFEKVEMTAENQGEDIGQKIENDIKKEEHVKESNEIKDNVRKVKGKEAITNSDTIHDGKSACLSQNVNAARKDEFKDMTAQEKMMAFFDTDNWEKRYKILSSLHDEITDTMIDNMAVVMDVIIEDGNLTKRYDDLKHAIHTKQRYEQNTRLR